MRIGIEAQRLLRTHKHGMDMVALHLIENLPQVAPQHQYIVFVRPGDDEEVLKRLQSVTLVYVRGLSYADWEQVWLPLAIAQNNIDVMHFTSNTASLYCPVPYVLTLHDVIYLESSSQSSKNIYQRLGALYRKWVVPVAAANAAKVVTVSNYETGRIEQLLVDTKSRLSYIYNAIDEDFGNKNSCAPHIESRLPEKFMFFLGNTDPKKNTLNVLLSFIHYRKVLKGNLPLVVGDFSTSYLKNILKKYKADELFSEIITLGYIRNTDLPFIYRKATFFLYPSLRESFGIPILEAMACGCPVVTSNTSSMPEIAGDASMLVNPEDNHDISMAMLSLEISASERNLLSNRGLEQVKKFSWRKSAEQYALLFDEAALSDSSKRLVLKNI